MKNTEIAFYSFKQFGYSLLHIGGNGDSVEVFCLFSMYLKNKTFKYLQKPKPFLAISRNHMYLDMGRDNDDDYDGESGNEDYYD